MFLIREDGLGFQRILGSGRWKYGGVEVNTC